MIVFYAWLIGLMAAICIGETEHYIIISLFIVAFLLFIIELKSY
jgi:hypothetical protein